MEISWTDVVGVLGVALVIGTYLALQLERIASTSLSYSVGNAMGALLIMISLMDKFNLSAFMVEAFWFAISVYGIVRVWGRKS